MALPLGGRGCAIGNPIFIEPVTKCKFKIPPKQVQKKFLNSTCESGQLRKKVPLPQFQNKNPELKMTKNHGLISISQVIIKNFIKISHL